MVSLARRNLFHDKIRLIVTLTGVIFSLVLIAVQVGLFLGFANTTAGVIEHTNADIWIAAKGLRNFDITTTFSERKLYEILSIPGVALAQKYLVGFDIWKRADGGQESVEIVGFDPVTRFGGPWNVVSGKVADLQMPDSVFVDELYKNKLQITHVGQTVEINNRRARVIGFTNGIRSFTTSPYVFASFRNAQDYLHLPEDQITYIIIRATPGTDIKELKSRIANKIQDVEILTTPEFARKTQYYWMFTTGAGASVVIAAIMGLVVGIVVVAQTIYATTMDHLKEFGTLKAMGASNRYIYAVIIKQAVVSGTIGYIISIIISYFLIQGSQSSGALILLPWSVAIGMFGLALLMCISASMVSISAITRIDPAMVFKG